MFQVSQALRRCIPFSAAFLLISSAAALGAFYGYQLGAHYHPIIGIFFALAAIGGAALAPFAVDEAITAVRQGDWLGSIGCTAFALIAIAYSAAAALSLANGTRSDLASARALNVDRIASLKVERDRAVSELATIAPARPTAEIRPLTVGLKATPGANNCELINGPISRRVCGRVNALESELGRARRKEALEQRVQTLNEDLALIKGVSSADPLASAVSVYANALGWSWDAEEILPWLALIPVAFLELGAALSVFVARAVSGAQNIGNARQGIPKGQEAPSVSADGDDPAEKPTSDSDFTSVERILIRGEADASVYGPLHRAIDLIKTQGGKFEGSTRELAKRLSIGKSTAHRIVQALGESGVASVEATTKGTRLILS